MFCSRAFRRAFRLVDQVAGDQLNFYQRYKNSSNPLPIKKGTHLRGIKRGANKMKLIVGLLAVSVGLILPLSANAQNNIGSSNTSGSTDSSSAPSSPNSVNGSATSA